MVTAPTAQSDFTDRWRQGGEPGHLGGLRTVLQTKRIQLKHMARMHPRRLLLGEAFTACSTAREHPGERGTHDIPMEELKAGEKWVWASLLSLLPP